MFLICFNKNFCINVSVSFFLVDRMRLIDFGFNDKDINNIDRIIEVIYELVSIYIFINYLYILGYKLSI